MENKAIPKKAIYQRNGYQDGLSKFLKECITIMDQWSYSLHTTKGD